MWNLLPLPPQQGGTRRLQLQVPDVCECTDQNGDGRNTVADLVAINIAIFNPGQITPLCDGDNDGACNVSDIIAGNIEIFSPTSTATCGRHPVPGL